MTVRAGRKTATSGFTPAGRDPTGRDIDPKLPITQQVYDYVRRAILTLELKPSEGLSEKDLALRLGISRTPVREALIKLADEGLIDILPQRGSFVAPIRMAEVIEAQFIREELEAAIARRTAERPSADFVAQVSKLLDQQQDAVGKRDLDRFLELDEAFHRAFSETLGLARSWRLIQGVKFQLDRVRYISLPDPGHLDLLLEQHRAIFEAVKAKDADRAEARMRTHLKEVFRSVERMIKDKPDLFA